MVHDFLPAKLTSTPSIKHFDHVRWIKWKWIEESDRKEADTTAEWIKFKNECGALLRNKGNEAYFPSEGGKSASLSQSEWRETCRVAHTHQQSFVAIV